MTSPTFDLQSLLRDGQGSWTLDPAGSSAEFHVKHFWGAITVHGRFERLAGEGTISDNGIVTGALRLEAGSLTTKMNKRDEHLRSAEFFDVERHPTVTVTVDRLTPGAGERLTSEIRLEVAGHTHSINPTVQVTPAEPGTVTLRAEVVVDRSAFGMTWSPLGMAARQARAIVTACFTRA